MSSTQSVTRIDLLRRPTEWVARLEFNEPLSDAEMDRLDEELPKRVREVRQVRVWGRRSSGTFDLTNLDSYMRRQNALKREIRRVAEELLHSQG